MAFSFAVTFVLYKDETVDEAKSLSDEKVKTPVIVTNTEDMGDFIFSEATDVEPGDEIMTVYSA